MIVPDARSDIRFQDNPLIGRSQYCFLRRGFVRTNGITSEQFCCYDHKPQILSPAQIES
jgi:hypothetical protein